MFFNLMKLFKRKKKLKKFSLSFEEATKGEDRIEDFNPEIKELLKKLKNSKYITHEETNLLIEFFFNKPPLKQCMYKLNETMIKGSSFSITGINTVLNEEGIPRDLIISLGEETYNSGLKVTVSIDEFHDFLIPIKLNKSNPEEKSNVE